MEDINNDLMLQLESFLTEQKKLTTRKLDTGIEIRGYYIYSVENRGVIFEGEQHIKVLFYNDYPKSIPKTIIRNVPKDFSHVNYDGSACLAVNGEIVHFLLGNPSPKEYIERFIDPYIFSIEWFKIYENYPFGEREHGYAGINSYYKEKWNLTPKQFSDLVDIVYSKNYRGHRWCICNSGKRLRNCHGKMVLKIVMDKKIRETFLKEAIWTLKEDNLFGKK